MNPNQDNRYDFIMNPPTPARQPMKFGNSMGARVIIVVGALFLLVIIIMIASSFAGQASRAQADRLTEVAKAESEINRITSLADERAADIATRNLSASAGLASKSSLQQTKQLLAKHGIDEKNATKILGASANEKVDEALDTAAKNNRFDQEFQSIVSGQINSYKQKLILAFQNGNKAEQEVLLKSFESAGILFPEESDSQEVSLAPTSLRRY